MGKLKIFGTRGGTAVGSGGQEKPLGGTRLRAFSLVETVVALVVILTVFGIATTILVRTGAGNVTVQQWKARGVLQAYANETLVQKAFTNAVEEREGFSIKREVTLAAGRDSLFCIHYYIYDMNKKMLESWACFELAGGGE